MIEPFWKTERKAIEAALWQTQGNIDKAAEGMGLGAATVYRKVKQFQIDVKHIRAECAECHCGEERALYVVVVCRKCAAEKGIAPFVIK
jgi:hypothetical protein